MQKRPVVVGLMLALLIAGAAWAQQPANATTVTGRVTSVNTMDRTFTIETSTGKLTFKTDAQTMFMQRNADAYLTDFKVGDQVEVSYTGQDTNRLAAHVHSVESGTNTPMTTGMVGGSTVTGRVTSVDLSGNRATIDTPSGSQTFELGTNTRILARDGSTDLSSIRTGDRVRVQLASDARTADRIEFVTDTATEGTMTAERRELPRTASPLPLLGLIGLGMIGAALALRARRVRTI